MYRLCFQINRIAIDKNRPVSKSPSAPAQNPPAQTRPAPPPQGAGAFAAATPPSQEGAGASGDDEENGRYILCVCVLTAEKKCTLHVGPVVISVFNVEIGCIIFAKTLSYAIYA